MSSLVSPVSLTASSAALRSGRRLLDSIEALCDRIERVEPEVRALIPEPGRRARLLREATRLSEREGDRPLLCGVVIGVKDIFNVDGFATRAGSSLPAELFWGPEASSVRRLRELGALVLGKTVTTEFAYIDPGATANPHDPSCTPGGSSSGSAAAVAAGYTPLALGSQTVGSVIRPASFCGVVGFKPSAGRIPIDGVVPFSPSVDHVGTFTAGVADARLAASVLCEDWDVGSESPVEVPTLGIPAAAYLEQATPEALSAFEAALERLEKSGFRIVRTPALSEIAAVSQRHRRLIAAEFAQVHGDWFARWGALYRPRSAMFVRAGQELPPDVIGSGQKSCLELRESLHARMDEDGIDLWASPATTGPAPRGLDSTGDPAMNLPWTHAGLPTLTLPAGSVDGLPLGLQLSARFLEDERLFAWAQLLERALESG